MEPGQVCGRAREVGAAGIRELDTETGAGLAPVSAGEAQVIPLIAGHAAQAGDRLPGPVVGRPTRLIPQVDGGRARADRRRGIGHLKIELPLGGIPDAKIEIKRNFSHKTTFLSKNKS